MSTAYDYDQLADPNWRHPAELMEPDEHDEARADQAEIIGQFVRWLWKAQDTNKLRDSITIVAASRRFAVCGWLMGLAPSLSQTSAAEALGFTPAAFSKIAVELGELLGGLRRGAMHSNAARQNRSERMRGVTTERGDGSRSMAKRHEEYRERKLEDWRERFLDGNATTTAAERALLRATGFMEDDSDELTTTGKLWVQEFL